MLREVAGFACALSPLVFGMTYVGVCANSFGCQPRVAPLSTATR